MVGCGLSPPTVHLLIIPMITGDSIANIPWIINIEYVTPIYDEVGAVKEYSMFMARCVLPSKG